MDGELPLFDATLDEGLTHSETLLPLVQRAFAEGGLSPQDISLWAATTGPGSFTGLRIGLSLLKGLALPTGTPAAGVSTLEAVARASGLQGTVVAALDARRSEVYWAAFEGGASLRRLTPDRAGPVTEIMNYIDLASTPVFFVGDGDKICYNTFNCYKGVEKPSAAPVFSVACGAAHVALRLQQLQQTIAPALLQPQYLRLSQAERQRAASLSQNKSDIEKET